MVKEPHWLGLPWTPKSRLLFRQTHQILSHCKQLRPMILLGGRYYLSTAFHNITLTASHAVHHLQLSPLSIIHVPCNMSFHSQHTGIGICPKTLRFSIPIFQNEQFSYIPWRDVPGRTFTIAVPDIPIPKDFSLDNSTLQSLDDTYDTLDRDLTLRLAKFNHDVDNLDTTSPTNINDILTYLSFAFTILNFLGVLFLFGRFRQLYIPYYHRPQDPLPIPLSTQTDPPTLN